MYHICVHVHLFRKGLLDIARSAQVIAWFWLKIKNHDIAP